MPYQTVLDEVLWEVGIDPQNSPWPLRGSKPLGLYRVIGWAHRNQRPDRVSNKSGRAVRYSGRRSSFCLSLGRGLWGLTEAGVERAQYLYGTPEVSEPIVVPEVLDDGPSEPFPEPTEQLPSQMVKGDPRDRQTWVVVELSHAGEVRVDEGTLESALRKDLDLDEDHPIFVPAVTYHRPDRVVTKTLIQGYVFIASGLDEVKYFGLETKTNYVNQVMSSVGSNGIRVLHCVSDAEVDAMRVNLRGLCVRDLGLGDRARVVEGRLKGLTVRVMCFLEDDLVVVETEGLRSLRATMCFPRMFLAVEDEEGEAVLI